MDKPVETERRLANVFRLGRVTSVNADEATAVVSFGDFESPDLPVGQMRTGALQFWWMPTEGEQVLVGCPSGDIAQGVIVCSIYAGNAPSSDGGVPMINLAGGRMIVDGTIEVTGDVIASGVSLVNHIHSGVLVGPSETGRPVK
jgi:phage baseplate assembly protein gpV